MTADPATLSVYDNGAQEYGERFKKYHKSDGLERFIARLPAGGTTLDLGCGVGASAARMRQAGLRVSALDASVGMAAEAQRLFGLTVQVAPFSALTAEAAYDGVWAMFSLLHAPRSDMPGHLARIATALRGPREFALALKTGTGEARDQLGRFYTYYTEAEIRDLLAQAGFAIRAIQYGEGVGFDNQPAPWMVISAHG